MERKGDIGVRTRFCRGCNKHTLDIDLCKKCANRPINAYDGIEYE